MSAPNTQVSLLTADEASRYQKKTLVVIPIVLAVLFALGILDSSYLVLSIAMGCVGGIVHDLIQNKGLVVFPHPTDQGTYLGLLLGTFLGGISGFFGFATTSAVVAVDAKALALPLAWGIGLKGLLDGGANNGAAQVMTTKP